MEPSMAGELGHLTLPEQRKLQESWVHLLRLCDTPHVDHNSGAWAEIVNKESELKKHMPSIPFERFRELLWNFILLDHPDALVLRFLRARKWNIDKALAMLISDMNWRFEHRIDERILGEGESVAYNSPSKEDTEFLHQFRCGKGFPRGHDRQKRPVYVIKCKLHDPNAQSSAALERYILHTVESIRTTVRAPNDKGCLLFDLTGFGVRNMDFYLVKFLTQTFEARYPETLGCVIVHKAPFIFWGIWKAIKGWLDPVVASKIIFTNSTADLEKLITKDNLQTSFGGYDTWQYTYIEPTPEDNVCLNKIDEKAQVLEERDAVIQEFEKLTIEHVSLDPASEEAKALDVKRIEVTENFMENYWKLEPYIRAATYYRRAGILNDKGEVNFHAAGT